MRGLFHFILSHSIFIAFCAAALSLQTLQLLQLTVNWYLLAFIFFATLGGYNAYWMTSKISFNRYSSARIFLQQNTTSLFVIAAAVSGIIYYFARLHLVMYNFIFTGILLGLYVIPVLPFKQLHFTRKTGFAKTMLLAFAWTMVTVLAPLQISILKMGHGQRILFINRFLFMLMLCIVFDKRDAVVDKIRGLQSLATHIKPDHLNYITGIIFIAYCCSSFLLMGYHVSAWQVAALLLAGLIALVVYILSFEKRGYVFYYFVVDGLMFLSALLTSLAGMITG